MSKKMSANMIRDLIKRAETEKDTLIKLRQESAVISITKDTAEAEVTQEDIAKVRRYTGNKSYEEYTAWITDQQKLITRLKRALALLNNRHIPSQVMGEYVTIHDLLVDLAFTSSEISHIQSISNNGLKPGIKQVPSYRSTGIEYKVHVYDEELMRERLNDLLDRQSALRREIDRRNESMEDEVEI